MLQVWNEKWRNDVYKNAIRLKSTLEKGFHTSSDLVRIISAIEKAILVTQPYIKDERAFKCYFSENEKMDSISTADRFADYLSNCYEDLRQSSALNKDKIRERLEAELLLREEKEEKEKREQKNKKKINDTSSVKSKKKKSKGSKKSTSAPPAITNPSSFDDEDKEAETNEIRHLNSYICNEDW